MLGEEGAAGGAAGLALPEVRGAAVWPRTSWIAAHPRMLARQYDLRFEQGLLPAFGDAKLR